MRYLCQSIIAVALCVLAVGCKVGPDYCEPPSACITEAWRATDDPEILSVSTDLAGWWTTFDDPTLNRLIDRAVAQNLDLREAALRIFEARAQRCIVRADLLPQITQDGSYSYSKLAASGALGGGGGAVAGTTATDQWGFGLNGSWEIDVFGRLRRLVEAADDDIAISIEDYRDTLVILLADMATNYVDARTYQRRLEIARQNLVLQKRTLDLTEKRFRAELTGELDVAQARANSESTASDIPALEAGYQQALNRLSVLLGCPPGEVDELMARVAPIPKPSGEIAVGIPADLLRRRPDIRSAERKVAAQTARIGAAIGEMYPKFSILGSFGLDAQDFGRMFDADAIGASIGPQMQWNILNFGRLRCNVYVQESRQQQYAVQYQNKVLTAAEEVDNALVGYVREKQRRQHLTQTAEAYQRAVELSDERYAGGDVSFQRVLDSQRSLLQSQDQLALSEASVTTNLIQLYRALGGGWQSLPVEQNELVVEQPQVEPVGGPEMLPTPAPTEPPL